MSTTSPLTMQSTTALLGLSTSLILSGVGVGASYITLPILYHPSVPVSTSLVIFEQFFYRGGYLIVPLDLGGVTLLASAAYLAPNTSGGSNKRFNYALAAVLALSTLAFTRLVMMPTIDTLLSFRAKDTAVSAPEVEKLLRTWNWMNLVRASLYAASGFLGLATYADLI